MDIQSELAALQRKNTVLITEVKATGRDLTDAEVAQMEQDAARVVLLKAAIARGEKNAATMDAFNRGISGTEDTYPNGVGGSGFIANQPTEAKGYLTPAAVKRMATASAADLSRKGLVAAGSDVIGVEFDPKPQVLATPGANLGILDLIAVTRREHPTYGYVRQILRESNAAIVPEGELKPTSRFTVENVTGSLDVIAHLSEYVGTYLFKDNSALQGFLVAELRAGIFAKVADLAATEFASTAGAQTQAFVDNAMDSIYLAASKSSSLGYNPDVVLLPRATYDSIMLAKDADGNYLYRRAEDVRINGLYPVVIDGAPDKAIVLDSSKVGISTDTQGIETFWDTYTRLEYNELRARVEGRFAIDVFAAPSIVVVDTAGE